MRMHIEKPGGISIGMTVRLKASAKAEIQGKKAPAEIGAWAFFELWKFQITRADSSETTEREHCQHLLIERFRESWSDHKECAKENANSIRGWVTLLAACINIEGIGCRECSVFGEAFGALLDKALETSKPGHSVELDRARDVKHLLYKKLQDTGLSKQQIRENADNIREFLYARGALITLISDPIKMDERVHNVAFGLSKALASRAQ